ncbi:MBOAT family protein [Reyranella sp. CPCC 100927]|uniref:MBOAT family O-acyltransferase n=1 Tax=Reyranella sp. CPCC 100927 TaxID=2599616 RepID=UPI0011B61434|nr:MBOAT family protein [Reyranella sp. CPCC 100927]TWT13865.1 MBOAT family protein [Reyranella sp. CPCC 100927]
MLFNSYTFILAFLPATLLLFFVIARANHGAARLFLLLASFAFYAWWSFEYGLLIVATIVVNYAFGLTIQQLSEAGHRHARLLLAVAIGSNLLLLGYFKYRNFFIDNVNTLTGMDWPLSPLVLPLAISFHTFQQIAYLVDSYRRKVEQPTLTDYALFVLFFPQLIAGPIVHHYQILPQFKGARFFTFNSDSFAAGLSFFVMGLAKKVLLADPLASVADPIFDGAADDAPALSQAWVGVLAYTLGLYFDFSGYSDMAVGLACMFGLRLPYNFNSPYKAASIIDFWRRWHITLSLWLRDYLYVPLGGNRHGKVRRYANLMATMLLGGLWHGAAWNFVFWGLLHGLYLAINHGWLALQANLERGRTIVLPPPMAWLLTFAAVAFAWVFFRSTTAQHAFAMVEGMIGLHGLHDSALAAVLGPGKAMLLAAALAIVLLMPNTQQLVDGSDDRAWLRWRPTMAWAGAITGLLLASLTQMSAVREFIYFQF